MEKLFNVPGWCTSWLIIYDPAKHLNEIRTNLEKLASIFLHTNVFTQRALPGILDKLGGPNHSKRFMHDIEKNHDMLVERFKVKISLLRPGTALRFTRRRAHSTSPLRSISNSSASSNPTETSSESFWRKRT
jgi:aspartate/methionine/tyrosine aminotransferase